MKNREIYNRIPSSTTLKNNGVAKADLQDDEMLRYELSTFVCTGKYEDGLVKIFQNFLYSLDEEAEQKAVWVSGFYGSGKSHLVKMLSALWTNTRFSDGQTAEMLADIPEDLKEQLTELRIHSKRFGGLHSAIGTLSSSSGNSVRLAVLAIVLKSLGLPEEYNKADFVLYLKENNYYDRVVEYLNNHDLVKGNLSVDRSVVQVAIACLLGYKWPAQNSPDMELDDIQMDIVNQSNKLFDKHSDEDGIVSLPSIGKEMKASDRLLAVLVDSYGEEWSHQIIEEVLDKLERNG